MKKLLLSAAVVGISALFTLTTRSNADDTVPTFSFTLARLPTKEELPTFLKNLKADTLPRIKAMHSCVQKTHRISEEYLDVKKLLFSKDRAGNAAVIVAPTEKPLDPSYDSNLLRNFTLIKESQTKSMDAITEFHNSLKISGSPAIADVRAKLVKIDEKVAVLANQLSSNAIYENNFLYLLDTSIEQLQRLGNESEPDIRFLGSDACLEVPVKDVAAFMAKDFQEMTRNVQELRSYVVAAREKRDILVSYLTQYHRYKLGAAYTSITGTELKNLQETLSATLVVGELVGEFSNWWASVINRGLGNYLDNIYSQYEEPLRVMRSREEIARGYLQRVDNIPGVLDNVKAEYKRQVNKKIDLLASTIKEHEQKGWAYQYEMQQVAVEFLNGIRNEYFEDCKAALDDWATVKVTTIEDFRIAETKFFTIRTLCDDRRTVKL